MYIYLYNYNNLNFCRRFMMNNQKDINIELVKGTRDDYTIKDKNKIVIGSFSILEID